MKANHSPDFIRSTARSGALGILLFSAAALPVFAADPPPPANPDAAPLKDESTKAGPDAQPVEDSSKAAGKDSRPVEDSGSKANERAQAAPKDTIPVEDSSRKANPSSTRVADRFKAAGKDSYRADDSNMNKAAPDARRTSDSSQKASPSATELTDSDRDNANPASRTTSSLARARKAGPQPVVPDEPTAFESETSVRTALVDAEAAVRLSKLQIAGEEEATGIIDGILAIDSPVSTAEQKRGEDISGAALKISGEVPDQMRTEVQNYLRDRLLGQLASDHHAPEFFRSDDGTATLIPAKDDRRFFHEGWRYVPFHSKTSVPAVLLANATLGNVRLQTAAQAGQTFTPGDEQLAVLPEEYRGAEAWVISYPVNKESAISSADIVFRRGSTQIADAYGYETIHLLADAMKDPAVAERKFAVEYHSSADGSFEESQALSQQRAEAVARELVRNGVSPKQLVPVGFGMTEATHPASASEELRSDDRRVIIFRMDETKAKK